MIWRLKYFIRYICPVFFKIYIYLVNHFSRDRVLERRALIEKYAGNHDAELQEVLGYIKKHKCLDMYNYEFCRKYQGGV